MKIVIAPDSFKGNLTAREVADAIEVGIRRIMPDVEIVKVPMADGGEGTVQALVDATSGEIITAEVTDPLGNRINAVFGILGNREPKTAVIEMASASGLPLVPLDKRNPMITTTYGTGELILKALDIGCKRLIIGIGGSATVDGGAGVAQALGIRLIDKDGNDIPRGGGGLKYLDRIDISGIDQRLKETEIIVACDVDNPLVGPRGASAVFGPQKGATPEMVEQLDMFLDRYADIIKRDLAVDVKYAPGAGAAGGLGAGLMAFFKAQLKSGIDIVISASGLENSLKDADLVITGEGKIDRQTIYGKTPIGVAKSAKKYGLPVIAFAGNINTDSNVVYENGIDGLMSIISHPMTLETAMERSKELLADASERAFRLVKLGMNFKLID
ncbi:TPA: glycerate kinase [Candidatus Poribacteria bacterium]|nr:glycerate kinase [Candidatus Poribacteria bacterium]